MGFMGFSAGGAITMAVMFKSSEKNTPNFIVPVYAWMNIIPTYVVPQHAPPMFVACASNDRLAPGYPVIDANLFQDNNGKYYLYLPWIFLIE
jgi:acetyl esterase/lipase